MLLGWLIAVVLAVDGIVCCLFDDVDTVRAGGKHDSYIPIPFHTCLQRGQTCSMTVELPEDSLLFGTGAWSNEWRHRPGHVVGASCEKAFQYELLESGQAKDGWVW